MWRVGFAGFCSKDAILESAFASGTVPGTIAFFLGVAALLTSFYTWRLIFLTFFGKPRWAGRSISSTRITLMKSRDEEHATAPTTTMTSVEGTAAITRTRAR